MAETTTAPSTLRIGAQDAYYWNQGTHCEAYNLLGAHPDATGTRFAVWAPHADYVAVVGDFNGWNPGAHPLQRRDGGLWEGFAEGAEPGQRYKFRIGSPHFQGDKTDPLAFAMEPPQANGNPIEGMAAIVTDLDAFEWTDGDWMETRQGPAGLDKPVAIYEVHLGSWMRKPDGYSLSYREIAEPLADHVERLGFTHVELLPIMEHPYYGSWGYQVAGYYATTFRYGSPQDLMFLINYLHTRGIGVILDWVPAHFAMDPQALGFFDGSPLFEYTDPQMRTHPDWGTYVFDYGKGGVRSFLVSNALFWFDKFHLDGLRFDAVASMLYRDYSRGDNWTPNQYGGRENLEAISLLQTVNAEVYRRFPQALMIAEESTSWPGVTAPADHGGLGFLYKWNMGWMHDTLAYLEEDPVNRKYHHQNLTFPLVYAWSEHFVLPLSHDEVVHLKGSLFGKMPGDDWQKAANLRLLLGHQVGHPGKKLLFMGGEFGQRGEWNHDAQIEWHLLDSPLHQGLLRWTQDLFGLYRRHPALWNDAPGGFHWLDADDRARSIGAYRRMGSGRELIFVFNFTPVPRENYRVGVMPGRTYRQALCSDDLRYGGSGVGNYGPLEPYPVPAHGSPSSLVVTLPPLGVVVFEATSAEERPGPSPQAGGAEAKAPRRNGKRSAR